MMKNYPTKYDFIIDIDEEYKLLIDNIRFDMYSVLYTLPDKLIVTNENTTAIAALDNNKDNDTFDAMRYAMNGITDEEQDATIYRDSLWKSFDEETTRIVKRSIENGCKGTIAISSGDIDPSALDEFRKNWTKTLEPYIGQPVKNLRQDFCNHIWKKYQGFTESYEYCEKCDKKRE
jgi:hypothetical protein